MLTSKDCRAPYCCNCGSEYQFTYRGKAYHTCHMLCDNFAFNNLKYEDIDSIIGILQDEIAFDMPGVGKAKRKSPPVKKQNSPGNGI